MGWHSELDDLTQEVFTRAFARIDELREPDAVRGWLRAQPGAYSCIAGTFGASAEQCLLEDASGMATPVDCGWGYLCASGVCSCTEQVCTANPILVDHFELNLDLDLTRADGSVAGLDSNVHNVHLTKS